MKNQFTKPTAVKTEDNHQIAPLQKGQLSFVGELHTHFPIAITEALKGDEIRLLFALKNLAVDGRTCHAIDQRELAKMMQTSQSTISRRMTILRVKRWVTLIHQNCQNLRGRNSFVVNHTPLSLEATLSADHQYLVFLQENCEGKNARIRQISKEELLSAPQDVLEQHQILLAETSASEENKQSPLCTNESRESDSETPLCTDDSPLCTNESRENDSETPLCTDDSPLCTNESRESDSQTPLCKDSSPLCTNESRENDSETPLCKDDSPLCTNESRESDSETPLCKEDSPLCTNESRENDSETPLCKDDPPLCTNESRDIYTTARTHAPAQSRIIINNNNSKITTSRRGDFDFFEKTAGFYPNPVLGEIIDLIRSDSRIGNSNAHTLINLLKRKRYETPNGEQFEWLCTEEKAIQLLVVILQVMPEQPLPFLKRLIVNDSQGDFALKRSQLKLLDGISAKVDPNYQPPTKAKLDEYLQPKTREAGIFTALFDPEQAKQYEPLDLESGMVIEALIDMPAWDMRKGQTTALKLPEFATNLQGEDRRNQLQAQFGSMTKTIYYGQLCKAIAMRLIKVCD